MTLAPPVRSAEWRRGSLPKLVPLAKRCIVADLLTQSILVVGQCIATRIDVAARRAGKTASSFALKQRFHPQQSWGEFFLVVSSKRSRYIILVIDGSR